MTDMTTGFGAVPKPEEPARPQYAEGGVIPPAQSITHTEPYPEPIYGSQPPYWPPQPGQYAPPSYSPLAPQGPQANAAVVNNIRIGGARPFNHMLHLVLTICTCGMWAPVWLVAYLLHPKG